MLMLVTFSLLILFFFYFSSFHLLLILTLLEFFVLLILISSMYSSMPSIFNSISFLLFSVCMGAVGISLFISISRVHGFSYFLMS